MIVKIGHTSELKSGDEIVIEGLGLLARTMLGVGDPAILPIVHVDDTNVTVRTPDGRTHRFPSGTREELLAFLASKTSFKRLYIDRPESSVAQLPGDEFDDGAMELGMPAEYGRMDVSGWKDHRNFRLGDFTLSVNPNNGSRRLWKAIAQKEQGWVFRLMKSDMNTEQSGEELLQGFSEPFDASRVAVFRRNASIIPAAPVKGLGTNGPGPGFPTKQVLIGGLALAAVAGIIWYLQKKKPGTDDD